MSKEKELDNLYDELDALEEELFYVKRRIDELEKEVNGDICINCNGSGEGQYDGTTCWSCKGKGVE